MNRKELKLFHKIADYAHKRGVREISYYKNDNIMVLSYGWDKLAFHVHSWLSVIDAIDDWIKEKQQKYGNKNIRRKNGIKNL
jgi:hypothetical protein